MSDEFMQNNANNAEPQEQPVNWQPQQPNACQTGAPQMQGDYQQNYGQPQYQNYGQPQYQNYGQPQENGKGLAIASMVLGIVACVFCWSWYIVIPTGVVGLILGLVYKKKGGQSGMAKAGIICSIVALSLLVLMYILIFAGAFAMSGWVERLAGMY